MAIVEEVNLLITLFCANLYMLYICLEMDKLITLSDKCIEVLGIEAVKKKKKFKHFVQEILETTANKYEKRNLTSGASKKGS